MPEPGTRDGRYRYLRLLGEGSSGQVWLAEEEERPGSPIALKLLASGEQRSVATLRREFATLSQLVHPNLIQVHALEEDPESGLPRIRMEFVAGVDIVGAVEREGRELWLDLAAEALRCLAFLHDFGMLHRDLKPANLIVRHRPRLGCRLVMLDFGLSARGDEIDAKSITAGTLPYIAPELFGAEPASPRSDLYALGAVLFQAIHGRTPITLKGSDTAGFIEAVRAGRRARPAVPSGYAAGLTAWLEELLAVDPQARPADGREALARFNAAAGTDYPPETVAGRSARLASGPPPGRERELERIWTALDGATTPRVVLVTGETGGGKRRLLHWLAGDAVARSWNLAQLRPDARRGHEFLGELRNQAQTRKTLVLLDPHEPLNSAALDFLERVATEGRKPPLRVLTAVQPSEHSYPTVRRLLEQSGRVPSVRRIELGPLDIDGIRSLAERSSGGAVSRSKVRWVFEQSEGSPDRAAAILVDGDWERGGRSSRRLDRDRSFTDRLAELTPASLAWLRSLSALGGAANEEMIAELAQLDPEASREAAAESLACGLVRGDASGYRTESTATADGVLLSIPEPERAKLVASAAGCWERADVAADPVLVARLHARAGQAQRAIELALEAAERAHGKQDAIAAAEGYAFALRQLERRDPRRLELRRRQGEALRAANLALGVAGQASLDARAVRPVRPRGRCR
jgi:serine/threonine protein kinase